MKKMKKGFTMIELVFVIVIIGILSGIAIPKFLETVHQAHDTAVITFVGTLNRSVAATLWNKSIQEHKDGKIISYCPSFPTYVNIPPELVYAGNCLFTPAPNSGTTLGVSFVDGTNIATPKWKAE